MENQHPFDAAPELAEAVTAEPDAGQSPTSAAGEQPKARHPRALVARLAEVYPNAFSLDGRKVRPLAVGILKELRAAREGEGGHGLSMKDLRRALRYYTQGAAYLRAVARGDARVNLAGEAVGEVSADQKAYAEAKLVELAPKLQKRPERPARQAVEGEAQAERSRRPRKPSSHGRRPSASPDGDAHSAPETLAQPAAARGRRRAEGKGEGRKPRRVSAATRPASKDETAPALSAEEKLNLLLEKFGGK